MKKTKPIRILGLDPGTHITGWALLEIFVPEHKIIDCGAVFGPPKGSLPGRLVDLDWQLRRIINKLKFDEAAVEGGFVGFGKNRNPPAQLALAEMRGVCKVVAMLKASRCAEYKPATVKKALTGNARAEKWDMIEWATRRFGVTESADTCDAIGVAVAHAERIQLK